MTGFRLPIAVIGLVTALTSAAVAQEIVVGGNRALDAAEKLLANGHADAAEQILKTLSRADGTKVDTLRIDYLAGMIAAGRGDHERAVILYRSILAYAPDLHGVRFQLGRSLVALKRDREAARTFAYLRGRKLPPQLVRDIQAFLAQIDDRRLVDVYASAALVPDTNINTATDEQTVIVGGVEQRLNDDGALRRAGVGLSSSLTVRLRPKITDRLRGDAVARLRLTDQSGGAFDFVTYGTDVGVRRQSRAGTFGLYATGSTQRFGGLPYAQSYGGRVTLATRLTKKVRASADLSVEQADYQQNDGLDGVTAQTALTLRRGLGDFSVAGLTVLASRHDAASDSLSYWRGGLALTYGRRLPWALTLQGGPSVYLRKADAVSPSFGVLREDVTMSGTVSVTKRDVRVRGFAPRLTYTATLNQSSISLYDYTRQRVDFGFTQAF